MLIDTEVEYEAFCDRLESAKIVALDTEFISERTYAPELCLVQLCADGESVLIDPLAIGDLTRLWTLLAQPGHETLVLAARSELEFALRAVGIAPFQLRDLQLAAGFVGLEYPLSAASLHAKLLRQTLSKSETRSNWHKRPLTAEQIEYARSDVFYLAAIWNILRDRLERTGRLSWFEEEMSEQIRQQVQVFTQGRWCRIPGQASLNPRQRNVLRELSVWRENEAQRRNLPPRRVVRDDLLLELARRMESRPERIFAIRGLDRPELARYAQVVAQVVQHGLSEPIPQEDSSQGDTESSNERSNEPSNGYIAAKDLFHTVSTVTNEENNLPVSQTALVVPLLHILLSSICRDAGVSPNLAATTGDLRTYTAWYERGGHKTTTELPVLVKGWRHELFGDALERFLDGKISFTIDHLRVKMIEMEKN